MNQSFREASEPPPAASEIERPTAAPRPQTRLVTSAACMAFLFAAGLVGLPIVMAALQTLVTPPGSPIATLVILAFCFAPPAILAATSLVIPMLFPWPIWLRCMLQVLGLTLGTLMFDYAYHALLGAGSREMFAPGVWIIVPVFFGVNLLFGIVLQRLGGWTVAESDADPTRFAAPSIRDLLELTVVASLVCLALKQLLPYIENGLLVCLGFAAVAAGFVGFSYLRCLSLKARPRQHQAALLATWGYALFGFYLLGFIVTYADFGFNPLTAMLLILPATVAAVMAMIASSCPLLMVRYQGLRLHRRHPAARTTATIPSTIHPPLRYNPGSIATSDASP